MIPPTRSHNKEVQWCAEAEEVSLKVSRPPLGKRERRAVSFRTAVEFTLVRRALPYLTHVEGRLCELMYLLLLMDPF